MSSTVALGTLTQVTTAVIGSTTLTNVVGVSWNQPQTQITGPPADGEVYGTVNEMGAQVGGGGSVAFRNPAAAHAAAGLSGSFVVTGKGGGQQVAQTVTFANATFGHPDANVSNDAAATASVPFAYASADGSTNPVTFAD